MSTELPEAFEFVEEVSSEVVIVRYAEEEGWDEEEGNNIWGEFAESRGFDGAREWRMTTFEKLGIADCRFQVYKVLDPATTLPTLYVNPHPGPQKQFRPSDTLLEDRTFATLASQRPDFVDGKTRLEKMREDFRLPSNMIGVVTSDEKVVIIDGFHRNIVIASNVEQFRALISSGRGDIFIALAETPSTYQQLIDQLAA